MVELVIKIPESEIPKQQEIIEIPLHFIDGEVCEAGGYEFDVLPKGHGRLIDADKIQFENTEFDTYGDYSRAFDAIDQADTIIEEDKEESDPWEKWLYPMKGVNNGQKEK